MDDDGLTTRERLEESLGKMKVKEGEMVGKSWTEDDLAEIASLTAKADLLVSELESDGRKDSKELGDISSVDGTGSGPSIEDYQSGKAISLDFTEPDLKSLYVAAKNRGAKAAMSSDDAGIGTLQGFDLSPYAFLRDKFRLLDYIPQQRTSFPQESFMRQTSKATGADSVAEGALKPESDFDLEMVPVEIRKIAHWTSAHDEALADFRQFMDIIGREMLAGLVDAENDQLINGDGVAPNQKGILSTVGIQTTDPTGDTVADVVAKAANLVRVATHFGADTVIMHPTNWTENVLLTKATDGTYLVGDPLSANRPRMWGMNVVLTDKLPVEDDILVANFRLASKAYIRQRPTLEVAPSSGTEFKENKTLIRAETRLGFAMPHPSAVVYVHTP